MAKAFLKLSFVTLRLNMLLSHVLSYFLIQEALEKS